MSLSGLLTCSLRPLIPGRKHDGRGNPAGRGRLGGSSCRCSCSAPRPHPLCPFPEPCTSPGAACWLGREGDIFWLWGNVIASSCRAKNQRQASRGACLSPPPGRPRHRPAASLPASMPPQSAAFSVPGLRSLQKVSSALASSPTAQSPAQARPPARPVRAHDPPCSELPA